MSNKIAIILIALIVSLFTLSIVLTQPLDDFSANPFLILQNFNPTIWAALSLSVIAIIFLMKYEGNIKYPIIFAAFAVLIPLSVDLSYRLTVSLPLSRELYHAAAINHVINSGNINFPSTLQPETIAPRLIGAILSMVTSIDTITIASYFPTMFYPGLFSLFTYVIARKMQIRPSFAVIAAIYGVALYFSILGMDRSTYCLPLYLLLALPILSLMKSTSVRSNALIVVLLVTALTISDLQFLILAPTLALIPLFAYASKKLNLESAKTIDSHRRFVNSAVLAFILFVGWSAYVSVSSSGILELTNLAKETFNKFTDSLSGEVIQPSFAAHYNSVFSFFINMSGYITAAALGLSIILLAYVLGGKLLHRSILRGFNLNHLIVLLSFFIPTSLLALFGYKRTALVWISLLTVYLLSLMWKQRAGKLTRIISVAALTFITLTVLISPAITWTTSETFISVKESYELKFLGGYLPENSAVLALHERGDIQTGINYLFANRPDIVLSNFFYRPRDVLTNQGLVNNAISSFSIIMIGSVMHSEAIYSVDSSYYVSAFINKSDSGQLNIVYSSGGTYYVFSKP